MSAQTLDPDLTSAVNTVDHRRLAVCAHEIGHAYSWLAAEVEIEKIYLRFGFLGGLIGGRCDTVLMPERDWSREQRTGYLVGILGGHAAEVRFCQLYLGMGYKRAFRYGREWAEGDYLNFDHWKSKLGLGAFSWSGGLSATDAFDEAMAVHEQRAADLDRLTVRLHHNRHLSGAELSRHTSRSRRGWFS